MICFKAKALAVGYHGKRIISDINIELERGKILTLVGQNGSGKSTILKTIAKQLESLGGVAEIYGGDIKNITSAAFARQAALVSTERVKTELLTCRDIVSMGRYPYTGPLGILSDEDKLLVELAFEKVNAGELKDRDYMRISDGQKQRVLLARALCQEPKVLILDEPTSYLDVRYIYDTLKILRSLADEAGVSVIMSLHQVELARKISDIVLCIKDGAVYGYGAPQEALTKERVCGLFDLDDLSYGFMFDCGGGA